ncbi:C4-dicarboxylate ABC transporter permease [Vibrio splendidus]|jgi:C4-dicarboxylate transporter, DctM subunit|uniref:TRAP transporter large permease protein n=1 Tax=Vibrio splendidus TaxID=29497 RepID=A0AB35MU88_VIBSP|nr:MULTISPECIES: TRAP transporter large permease [Vibrio]OBT18612.1 C4-dicarboxylate ABC transporter permease [Vibrio tasmaniensis]MBO7911385.1 TRAP transporter large permease [Vibrio sp. G41H]MCF7490221.1 TRAP transporter large permease [Vibrio sp. G-C-1]MCW4444441.1 TRAP transporter large permease [Vibrio splendidus]MDP2500269.1 TRAP transporter large permease [Vibrio splendidus]
MLEWYEVGLGLMGLLILFIVMGLPIPFALAGASVPFLLSIQSFSTTLVTAELKMWGVWVDYVLLSVPLFVLLGELIGRSNIGPNLYWFMHSKVPITGSAAYGSVGACAGFGAVCGSSMVGSLTIGGVALPAMLDLGYDKKLASGVLAAGGTLSVLLPPSLILLFYGIVTDQSIGQLFIAGVVPGLILVSFFFLIIKGWSVLQKGSVPGADDSESIPWGLALSAIIPVMVIGLIITVSIYAGIATPTEAAGVSCVITLLLAMTVGGMDLKGFFESIKATMKTMGYLGLLLSSGVLFGFVMTYYQVPQEFTSLFTSLELSPYTTLALIILFYIILGMFLEPVSMTFITLPTLFPLIQASGFDLIWFGVIYTITMEVAVLTPPVGLNLYVIQSIEKDRLTIVDVIKGCLPFIGALIFLIVLMVIFPQLAVWLPNVMG